MAALNSNAASAFRGRHFKQHHISPPHRTIFMHPKEDSLYVK